jgi:two-component system response regulator RstA
VPGSAPALCSPHRHAHFARQRHDQILSLELGANDFILKTTPPPVLLARLRVQFRQQGQASRPWSPPPQRLQFGRLR